MSGGTYVHGIVLVELWVLLDLAHVDDDGGDAIEDLVAGAFVALPGSDEMIDALLEELSVDLDVGHLDSRRERNRVDGRWATKDVVDVFEGRLAVASCDASEKSALDLRVSSRQ